MNILSFGGGVDSTTLIAIDQNRDRTAKLLRISREELDRRFPVIDRIVFSDTGAEHRATYEHIQRVSQMVDIDIVSKDGESIAEWCERLGIVPLMPGASHICSLKFKGEVMGEWAKQFDQVTWLIGIEADEGRRAKRFQKPKDDEAEYLYPLIELGLTRDRCELVLTYLGWDVPEKSSCTFCPFKSEEELIHMRRNDPEAWEQCKRIEASFRLTSAEKHQRWIDAGQPLSSGKRPRAPVGMWRKDSWAEGARLFAKKIDGRQLSVEEWGRRIDGIIARG